jgi:single-strand DNA-binding protein
MNTNMVVLEGGLTRDPEIREAGKSQVANFGIACSKRIKKGDEWVNGDPQYFDIQAWGSHSHYLSRNWKAATARAADRKEQQRR